MIFALNTLQGTGATSSSTASLIRPRRSSIVCSSRMTSSVEIPKQIRFDLVPNVFQLYKLHGSVDWALNIESREIERDPKTLKPVLVYPRNSKYELAFSQPYLEMMSALQTALRQSDTGLLILGFGFNDSHIAEPVLAAIRSNLSLQVVVCDPGLGPQQVAADAPLTGGQRDYLTTTSERLRTSFGKATRVLL